MAPFNGWGSTASFYQPQKAELTMAESTFKPQIKPARKQRKLRNYYGQKCRCTSYSIRLHEFLTVVNITEKN